MTNGSGSMGITPGEAREALETVRRVEERTRRAIALAGGGPILMIWGVVWLVGYLGGHFLESAATGWVWLVADLAGLAGTVFVVTRVQRWMRDPGGRRIGLFWVLLLAYALLWIWASRPLSGAQVSLIAASVAMFGYAVMGLWLDRIFLWIGLGVTAIAIAGYLLLPAIFGLWMAVLGGGALLWSGVYIHRRWR